MKIGRLSRHEGAASTVLTFGDDDRAAAGPMPRSSSAILQEIAQVNRYPSGPAAVTHEVDEQCAAELRSAIARDQLASLYEELLTEFGAERDRETRAKERRVWRRMVLDRGVHAIAAGIAILAAAAVGVLLSGILEIETGPASAFIRLVQGLIAR